MKKLFLSVTCANDHYDEAPNTFHLEMSSALVARIKELSRLVSAADAFSIDEFNYDGTWSDTCIDSSENVTPTDLENLLPEIVSAEARVDIPMLVVTKHIFKFTATPKHCGEDVAVVTTPVRISDLDNDETLILLD
jgi:hypothetical protein